MEVPSNFKKKKKKIFQSHPLTRCHKRVFKQLVHVQTSAEAFYASSTHTSCLWEIASNLWRSYVGPSSAPYSSLQRFRVNTQRLLPLFFLSPIWWKISFLQYKQCGSHKIWPHPGPKKINKKLTMRDASVCTYFQTARRENFWILSFFAFFIFAQQKYFNTFMFLNFCFISEMFTFSLLLKPTRV